MKLAVVSDLHLDYHKPKIATKVVWQLINVLDEEKADWIVLAGDLSTAGLFKKSKLWCELWESIADRTIFVPGNHDFYGVTIPEFWERVGELGFAHTLHNDLIEVDGVKFYGGTLWFNKPIQGDGFLPGWCDYEWIKGPKTDIYDEAAAFRANFPDACDIIVTHHLPTERSVAPRFKYESTNCFYVNDCEDLIRIAKPKYWIHGHTHDPLHYQFNKDTNIICNPLGYPNQNTGRYDIKIIEI